MNMIRKQVFVTKEQSRQLKARARVAGVSEAALIRAGIDRELMVSNDTAAWKERLMRMAGSLKAADSSSLYARNLLDFLKLVTATDGSFAMPAEDDIVTACLVTHAGEVKRA